MRRSDRRAAACALDREQGAIGEVSPAVGRVFLCSAFLICGGPFKISSHETIGTRTCLRSLPTDGMAAPSVQLPSDPNARNLSSLPRFSLHGIVQASDLLAAG